MIYNKQTTTTTTMIMMINQKQYIKRNLPTTGN